MFQDYGAIGGRTRAQRMDPAARSASARRAVIHRWIANRFGGRSFAELGLPGGEIIDTGLIDLCEGVESEESLLVSLAEPRLRREGVPVPRNVFDDADIRLYRRLETVNPGLAHARYRAYLRQAQSFADACPLVRRRSVRHAN